MVCSSSMCLTSSWYSIINSGGKAISQSIKVYSCIISFFSQPFLYSWRVRAVLACRRACGLLCVSNTASCAKNTAAKRLGNVSNKILSKLFEAKLVDIRQCCKKKYYIPALDAVIVYSEKNDKS